MSRLATCTHPAPPALQLGLHDEIVGGSVGSSVEGIVVVDGSVAVGGEVLAEAVPGEAIVVVTGVSVEGAGQSLP